MKSVAVLGHFPILFNQPLNQQAFMECQLCAGPWVDDNGPPGFTCKMLGQPGDESWEATWVKGSTGPLTGFWRHPGPFRIPFPTEGGPCSSEGDRLDNESPGCKHKQRKKVFVRIRRSDGAFRPCKRRATCSIARETNATSGKISA